MKECRRKVSTYDPSADLADVVYMDKDGKPEGDPQKFLETKFRQKWFYCYLRERKLQGYLDDSNVEFLPDAQVLIARATVWIDGKLAGASCSGEYFSPKVAGLAPRIAQNAETSALGRALANAGFGTAACVNAPADVAAEIAAGVSQSGFRACQFDPMAVLTSIEKGEGASTPYLRTLYQVEWFQQYLEETGLPGYLDNSEVRYDPASKLFTVTATVYIGGMVAGRSSASARFDPAEYNAVESSECPVRNLGTAALGRALANAGFDVTATSLDAIGETPCDGGIKVSRDAAGERVIPVYQFAVGGINAPRKPSLPPREMPTQDEAPAEKPKGKPGRKPKAAKEQPVDVQISAVKAPDENTSDADMVSAMSCVIPVGPFKGMTIAQVLNEPKGLESLEFYASEQFNNPKLADFKKAVIVALS